MLIRSAIVPKSDAWVTSILELLIKNGFFYPRKARKQKVRSMSDLSLFLTNFYLGWRWSIGFCEEYMSREAAASLGGLIFSERCPTSYVSEPRLNAVVMRSLEDTKSAKFHGKATSGELWTLIAAKIFKKLGKDKDLRPTFDAEDDAAQARTECWSLLKFLEQVSPKASMSSIKS